MVGGRGMANGRVTGSNGKIGSAHSLPTARISEELEEIFSVAAETPLGSSGEGKEMRQPLTN